MNASEIKKFVRHINSIADERLRQQAAAEKIMGFESSDVVDIFSTMLLKINSVDEKSVYYSLIRILLDEKRLPEPKKMSISREFASRELKIFEVMINKIKHSIKVRDVSGHIYEFEELPLGVRKAKARTHNRDLLLKLLFDPSPDVIQILLGNPLLKEEDVVRIVSRRPQNPEIFPVIFFHETWLKRQSVHRSMVKNPCTPPYISISLVPLLDRHSLIEIQADETIYEKVREAAMFMFSAHDLKN